MKRDYWRAICTTLIVACVFIASGSARAQETSPEPEPAASSPAHSVSEKFDEYGRVGHCDWTARLDNFAIKFQQDPTMSGYVVTFDSPNKNRARAEWELDRSQFYLTHERGIDPSRIVFVNGGEREDVEIVLTELWIVPPGAVPPVAPPEINKYTAPNFSGVFNVYHTDEHIYQEMIEMGYSSEHIAHVQFATKLKEQPESVGYLVIRASKNGAPGAWRRIARRDEDILQREHGIEAARLRSIDGGRASGESAQVELWILPKNATPPAGATETPESKHGVAYRINRYDSHGVQDADAERWMLENLAEALRADPQAFGYLIAREQAEVQEHETYATATDVSEPASLEEEAPQENSAQPAAQLARAEAVDAPDAAAADAEYAEPESQTMMECAVRLKKTLAETHGIEAHRIVIVEGRPMAWSTQRLTMWVVPEKAQPPDPLAPDADEVGEVTQQSRNAAPDAVEEVAPTANAATPPDVVRAPTPAVASPSFVSLKDGRELVNFDSKRWW